MKKILFVHFFLLSLTLCAQERGKSCSQYTGIIDSSTNKFIYTSADIYPSFVDPKIDLTKFVLNNLKDLKKKYRKSEIRFSFVVQPNGDITHKKILQAPDAVMRKRMLEILDILPPMNPGKVRKATVPVLMQNCIVIPK
jgi:hypothetical protein